MAINLVSRSSWGARPPSGSYSTMPTNAAGVKVHYTGGYVNPNIVNNHALCAPAVRGIQNGHMDGNGWIDIGYSMVACPHRRVFVGRGPKRVPAANGAGLNSQHYAVLGLVGNSGLTQPTDDMLHGIRDAIEYLRANGPCGNQIKGHRDGYATACPGQPLYNWVLAGAPRPSAPPTPPPPPPPEEEEVPEVVSLGLGEEQIVPANGELQPWWHIEYKDTANWHPANGQSIAPNLTAWGDFVALLKMTGATGPVKVGFCRALADGTFVDDAWQKEVWPDANGRIEVDLNAQFSVSATNRARVRIVNPTGDPITLRTSGVFFKAILFPGA